MKKVISRFFVFLFFMGVANVAYEQNKITARDVMPTELRGLTEQRVNQNLNAESLGIRQIADDRVLAELVRDGVLTKLVDSVHYFIDRGTETKPWKITRRVNNKKVVINCDPKPNEVFVYPFVKKFLDKLAADYFSKFNKKLKITSGARSLEEQISMRTRWSCYFMPTAALAGNVLEESLHVRGTAIDISRKGMKAKEIKWIRERLIADKTKGVEFEVDPIEERSCFHIVVFPK